MEGITMQLTQDPSDTVTEKELTFKADRKQRCK